MSFNLVVWHFTQEWTNTFIILSVSRCKSKNCKIAHTKKVKQIEIHNQGELYPRHTYFESARIKQNQPVEEFSKFASHSGGNFKPSHTRGGMSRNDGGIEIIYIFLDMRFGGVLNYVRTHSRADRDVPTEFEPHSSGNRKIPTTFELHSSWILVISK